MNFINILKKISAENGGIIDNKTAEKYGVSRAMLSKLSADGLINRIVRGQYIFANDMQDEILSVQKRVPNAIFSHETALFLHGLSDRTPFEHSFTVQSDKMPSKMVLSEYKVYYIKQELFELGKATILTPHSNQVTVYDFERTICDIVRSRNKIGTETFLFALKAYSKSPKKDLNKLSFYAKELRVLTVLKRYLEVLL